MDYGSVMSGHYDPDFVVVSAVIALLSAYAALDLAGRITFGRSKAARLTWLSGGAASMGIGIWSMHYIGMLAFRMHMTVLYDWPTVLLSLAAAIVASGTALFIVSRKTMGLLSAVFGSVCMGGGIAAMHYIGMAAMRMPATRAYNSRLVLLSIVSAVVIAFVALRITFASRQIVKTWTWKKGCSALLMGLAIPIMHYIGMAAVQFAPAGLTPAELKHAVNISDLGAASIALVTVVVLCLVFLSAIVDRKFSRNAEELQSNEERYRHIIGSAFDAFIGVAPTGKITDWNEQAAATFGWSSLEAVGRSVDEFIQRELEPGTFESIMGRLASETDTTLQGRLEVVGRHKSGAAFAAEMAISAVTMRNNSFFAAFVHDVTERRLAERHMEEARASAEAANRAKSEFLANMSHEIRTPLNGVIGMTDLALETELTREQREYLETVKLSADSLLTVINDILDFSKIEAGKVELEEIRFDLRECLENTLKTLALRADEKGLELLCDIDAQIPDGVIGDPGRMRQIVTNLVGNAIKFTDEGEVAVQVKAPCDNDGGVERRLHFTISDTGIGISPEKLETIFESFNQADTSTTRQYGGTGLGLTISKRLIEIMGGRIWIESELGKGSHFNFIVPLKKAALEEEAESSAPVLGMSDTKVLIVDDNKTNRRILEGLLRKWGMNPTSVADGASAVQSVAAARESGDPYRLILTDMHMPKMDGFMVVQKLQENTACSPATVMMLSSGGHRGDAAKCQALGIAAYLLKPVRQTELQEAIARALGAATGGARPTMITQQSLQEERPASQSLSILLAEDNEVNQKLAVRLLEKRGHRVVVVHNGREAISALEKTTYDLVLMDVQMPEMDGIEATIVIRGREQHTGLRQPIVAMTALVMKGDRERCLAAKMDGYLSKPIRPQELDEVLDSYTARKHSRIADRKPTVVASQVIDIPELLERIDGDLAFVAELSEAFSEDFPRQIETAHASITGGDTKGLKRAAHSLKGALANLSASHAAALAAALERVGASGSLEGAAPALEALEEELPRVLQSLRELSKETVL